MRSFIRYIAQGFRPGFVETTERSGKARHRIRREVMRQLFALVGDSIPLIIIWRGSRLVFDRQQKMFETASDYKLRRTAGLLLMIFGVAAIIVNHTLLNY